MNVLQRETNLRVAVAILTATVRSLLASAVPNERDHPTMFREWKSAKLALEDSEKWIRLLPY